MRGLEVVVLCKRERAFMLIELLTVFFIISAIVLITIPNLRWNVDKVNLSVCQSNLKNLSTSLQLYANDYDGEYPDELTKLTPTYIKIIPTCPSAGTPTYIEGYVITDDHKTYTVYCKGKNHVKLGLGEDEPFWSLQEGLKP